MTPDDWNQAMHHEAEFAPDPTWAADARRSARRLRLTRTLLGDLLLGQTLLVALALILAAPTVPGPWLALAALALSLRALRTGEIGWAGLGLASGWAALASAPGAQGLLGTGTLPPMWELLALAMVGVGLLSGLFRKQA